MTFSISQKQNYFYTFLILLTIFASIFSYRHFEKQWLLYRAGEVKFQAKSFDEAIFLYNQSLAIGASTPRIFLNLANSYVAIGNFNEAIRYYRLYLEKYPKENNVRLLLARALGWNGKLEESEAEYQKLLEGSP